MHLMLVWHSEGHSGHGVVLYLAASVIFCLK